jgi:predicted transcriptional regulator
MNYDIFKDSLKRNPILLEVGDFSEDKKNNLDNEALFQLPFIAMTILAISKGISKPLVSELGRLVGECLEQSMPAFKKSNQHISWSANLRVRTVKAMSFLEMAGLIEIESGKGKVKITNLGKKVISRALEDEDSDLHYNLSNISRQYRNINKASKLELRLN